MEFIKNFLKEIAKDGKSALGIWVQQSGMTSFPGIVTALHTASTDHTLPSYIDLAAQVLLVVGATIQTKKVVVNAVNKSVE